MLRPFVSSLEPIGVIADFRKSLNLRWRVSPDETGSFGYIDVDGRVWPSGGWGTASRLGKPEAGECYLQEVANAVGGSIRRYEKAWPEAVGADKRPLDVRTLVDAGESWKAAMTDLMAALQENYSL